VGFLLANRRRRAIPPPMEQADLPEMTTTAWCCCCNAALQSYEQQLASTWHWHWEKLPEKGSRGPMAGSGAWCSKCAVAWVGTRVKHRVTHASSQQMVLEFFTTKSIQHCFGALTHIETKESEDLVADRGEWSQISCFENSLAFRGPEGPYTCVCDWLSSLVGKWVHRNDESPNLHLHFRCGYI
jgi:hypothetical protein